MQKLKPLFRAWSWLDDKIQKVERGLLVLGIMTILVVGVIDIALRSYFGWGLSFTETLSREITVLLGLFGATLATAHNEHINIDAVSRLLKRRGLQINYILVGLICAAMSFMLLLYSLDFVKFYMGNKTSMITLGKLKFPTWTLLLAFPVCFVLITSRYLLQTIEYTYAALGDPLPWSLVTQKMEEELLQRTQGHDAAETEGAKAETTPQAEDSAEVTSSSESADDNAEKGEDA